MPFSAGDKLGPYEILAPIGAGGMGEVYRARDTKLDRDVAIKVLPAALAQHPDRIARFEREAKVLASLNHPNIAQIYGIEESNGVGALVMELVPGQTLKGPVPLETALGYAKQIADALEAAHEKGITHRDLKPANIMITPAGVIKVLDFGLAKAAEEPATAGGNPSISPTLTLAATNAGMIMGTAAYMSPEQASGKPVDKRADIWSFGVVLWEMLTGKRLFDGETISHTLAAVLTKEPDFQQVPSKVRRLLRRCLEKEPKRRLRDIGEAWFLLEEARVESGPAARSKLPWAVTAALAIALMVIHYRQSAQESAVVKFFISAPDKILLDTSGATGIPVYNAGRISPNGRKLAFAARDESVKTMVWVRALDTLAAQPLMGTEGAALPFWSPDSRSIAFFAQGKLKRIDIEGGPPQTICDAPSGRGGSWNRAGVIVFAPDVNGPLKRVSSTGGETVAVTKFKAGESGHRFPYFLPDDRHFLYTTTNEVFAGSLDSVDAQQRVLTADSPPVFALPGYILFVRQGALLAQQFDATKLRPSGEPVPIAEQVINDPLGQAFSVSENDILTYRTGVGQASLQLTWVDATGKLIQSIGAPGDYLGPDLSADGKRIAIHRHEGAGGDLWIVETSTGKTSRLTFDASQENASPIWSPDGSHIAFGSRRNGKWGIYQKSSNGTGSEELLFESEVLKMPMGWSAGGKWILYMTVDAKTGQDIWALPLSGDRKALPILQTPFNEGHPQFSPDGKWFAYESNETGRSEIYVQSFPLGAGKWQISSNGGWYARWSRDGRKLFYMDAFNLGKIVSVGISATGSTLESSAPVPLFDSAYINTPAGHSGNWNTFAVSSDNQRFLIPRPEANLNSALTSTPITVVLNWTQALRKK